MTSAKQRDRASGGAPPPLDTHCLEPKPHQNASEHITQPSPAPQEQRVGEKGEPRGWKHAERKEEPAVRSSLDTIFPKTGHTQSTCVLCYLKTSPAFLVTQNCSGVQSSFHCEHILKNMTPIFLILFF